MENSLITKDSGKIAPTTTHSISEHLPFYSSASLFIVLIFAMMTIFILIKNVVTYFKYGITGTNDYYTEHNTLKIGALLLSVFAGEALMIGLLSTFYIHREGLKFGVHPCVNTAMLNLISVCLLLGSQFYFGTKITMK